MIPGEIITKSDEIVLNKDSDALKIKVSNTGDRPIQIGSHYHFYETNEFLSFDRNKTKGMESCGKHKKSEKDKQLLNPHRKLPL